MFFPELQKTQKAIEISNSTDLFLVPKIISFDKKFGTIVYQKINDSIPIHRIDTSLDIWDILIFRLGRIMSSIHWFNFNNDSYGKHYTNFIHGDFSVINILYTENNNNICIIDWSMSDLFNGYIKEPNYLLDISWFNISFLSLFNGDLNRYFDLINKFLLSYLNHSPLSKYPKDIINYHNEIFTIFINHVKKNNQLSKKKLYVLNDGYDDLLEKHIVKYI